MDAFAFTPGRRVAFDYVNWRGERARRVVEPVQLWFGATEYHPEPQWLLKARDVEKGAMRDFALKDIDAASLGEEA